MAERITLARPYARAAFEVAKAEGKLQQWSEALNSAAAVTHAKQVKNLLASPGLTGTQKSAALNEVLGSLSNATFRNFVVTLAENKRLLLLPEIRDLFLLMKSAQEKSIDVAITTAYPITDDLLKKLSKTLSQKLERQVSLTTVVDESLLGGALIRAGDTVIDGSVKGRLAKLAEAMNA